MPQAHLFTLSDLPESLIAIPSLDFAADLLVDPLEPGWFRLGARSSAGGGADNRHHVMRKCFLIRPTLLKQAFAQLSSIGNVIGDLGLPSTYTVHSRGGRHTYHYRPAHAFDLNYSGILVEALVAERLGERKSQFLINPDLWLHLDLAETRSGSGVWVEVRTGTEVLRERPATDNLGVVEIQRNYLLRYLRDRQRALVIGHYADVRVDQPTDEDRSRFIAGRVEIERTRPYRAKVMFHGAVFDGAVSRRREGALYRQMHLWFSIPPPSINPVHTLRDEPSFDVRAFTLPTRHGDVVPERFIASANLEEPFAGVSCDFMTHVFFRQEVIERYQDSAIFSVDDNGAIHCGSFWGLYRSTRQYGNEYISTAIGDFAEGVPYDEWPHWRQYAMPPPGRDSLRAAAQRQVVDIQVESWADRHRGCEACGKRPRSKGRYSVIFMTLYGDVRLSSPRLHRCSCQTTDGPATVSPRRCQT